MITIMLKQISNTFRQNLGKAIILLGCLIIISCGSGKPGDVVPLPPLPPYDPIYGFFSKIEAADFSDDSYKIRDLPFNFNSTQPKPEVEVFGRRRQVYAADPSQILVGSQLSLYFTSVYIDTNPECSDTDHNEYPAEAPPRVDYHNDPYPPYKGDPECTSRQDISETNLEPECNDGIDNDGDTLTDFIDPDILVDADGDTNPANDNDTGCSSIVDIFEDTRPQELPECGDGIDNDGDTNADFPADPACLDATDLSERSFMEDVSDKDKIDDVILSTRIQFGKLMPASPYISSGPDGVMQSGLGGDDVQWTTTQPLDLCSAPYTNKRIVVGPGLDKFLQTNIAGDEMEVLIDIGGVTGVNNVVDPTTDDIVVSRPGDPIGAYSPPDVFTPIIMGGPNGKIDSPILPHNVLSKTDEFVFIVEPGTLGNIQGWTYGPDGKPGIADVDDDSNGLVDDATEIGMGGLLGGDVKAGVIGDGCPESGLGENDVQNIYELIGPTISKWYAQRGIPVGNGEPGNMAVSPGADGFIQTNCVQDDTVMEGGIFVGKDFWDKKNSQPVGNGVAQSGLAGDDVQVFPAGIAAFDNEPYTVLVRPGLDGVLDTVARGPKDFDDELTSLVLAQGYAGLNKFDLILLPGFNAKYETCPAGDDLLATKFNLDRLNGPNSFNTTGVCQDQSNGSDFIIVGGPNGLLDSVTTGDDEYCGHGPVDQICPGPNGVLDSLASLDLGPDGAPGILNVDDNADGITDNYWEASPAGDPFTGLGNPGGDTLLFYEYGWPGSDDPDVVVGNRIAAGPNGFLDTPLLGDDEYCTPYAICPGPDGVVNTDVNVNMYNDDDLAYTLCAGSNGNVDTSPLGDDIYAIADPVFRTVDSGLWNDDIQLVSQNYLSSRGIAGWGMPIPILHPGPDGVIDTPIQKDDVKAIYNMDFPIFGVDADRDGDTTPFEYPDDVAKAQTTKAAGSQDIQVIAPGNPVWVNMNLTGIGPPVYALFPTIISGSTDGELGTVPTGGEVVIVADVGSNLTQYAQLQGAGLLSEIPTVAGNGFIETGLAGRGILDPYFQDFMEAFKFIQNVFKVAGGVSQTTLNPGSLFPTANQCDYTQYDNGADCSAYCNMLDPSWGGLLAGINMLAEACTGKCVHALANDPNLNPFDFGAGGYDASQCIARTGRCPDDCQNLPGGTIDYSLYGKAFILPGDNYTVDTTIIGNDEQVIVDGPNKIGESGLGGDDFQIIPAGQGAPDKIGIANIGMPDHSERIFTTTVARDSDDVLVDPSAYLNGGEFFDWDNLYTNSDADFDEEVDNLAAADDGEYFAVFDTNIDAELMPSHRDPQSISVIHDPANPGNLIGYISDGRSIYRSTSTDGETWSTPVQVLTPGVGYAGNVVVTSGVDGICETVASGDDYQLVQPGFGRAYAPAITAGEDIVFSSLPGGDDVIINGIITTGRNGIRETTAQGDDRAFIALWKGQPDSKCIISGANVVRDTPDAALGRTTCGSLPADPTDPYYVSNTNPGSWGAKPIQLDCASDVLHIPTIIGIDILSFSADTPVGVDGIIAYDYIDGANKNLTWQAPTETVPGPTVNAAAGGVIVLTADGGSTITLQVNAPKLPTSDYTIPLIDVNVGDDRPPFWDIDGDSHYTQIISAAKAIFQYPERLPEEDEPAVEVGDVGGFDGLAIQDPDVVYINGVYYMYYTAIGPMDSYDVRFNQEASDTLGPVCPRNGFNGISDYGVTSPSRDKKPAVEPGLNVDNTGEVVILKRIGVATSVDGVNWIKSYAPAIDVGHVCAKITDMSFMSDALGLDATGFELATLIGPTDFDYGGAFAPEVYAEIGQNGEPLFTMFYNGKADNFNIMTPIPPEETYDSGNSGDPRRGASQFIHQVGVARSTDGINFTKIDSQNPLYVKPLLASLAPETVVEEYGPEIQRRGDVFYMYHQEKKKYGNENYLVLGKREGAVFGGCLSVANMKTPLRTEVAAVNIAILALPLAVLIWRKRQARKNK